ncbi:hypothetical protein E2F46_08865 [Luteimonas aestuarii]|jgi:hypothetical protein|uniref:Uncharacterized protein n=1 Tax=Luteimonas aestuarii TaxID=453837 RepID=A0A4R5TTP2_9GAMM|nr:hypothetical protein [Luteimonas aestuarii]TDK24383.1 hypothetical protein E2F46_08865 [Luteimonas aestuarii]
MSSEPVMVGYVLVPATVAAMTAVAAGAWIVARAMRTRASHWLFAFVVASIAWIPASLAMHVYLPGILGRLYMDEVLSPRALIWVEAAGFAFVVTGAALCFLLVALQVRASREASLGKPDQA